MIKMPHDGGNFKEILQENIQNNIESESTKTYFSKKTSENGRYIANRGTEFEANT